MTKTVTETYVDNLLAMKYETLPAEAIELCKHVVLIGGADEPPLSTRSRDWQRLEADLLGEHVNSGS